AEARDRARQTAGAVGRQADVAARAVRRLHEGLGHRFARTQLSSPQIIASFQEFDREFRKLDAAVRAAVEEYLGGNALVLDFIVDHDLERPAVRHAVRVAALATQLLVCCPPADVGESDRREELVHLFLGGFLHDCGQWDEPWCFAEGHEVRGAALAAAAVRLDEAAPRLEKMILFHSDLEALATSGGAAFVRLEGEQLYRRLVADDADRALDQAGRAAGAAALDERDRRDALALGLAERWVSELDEVQFRNRNHRDLLAELVGCTGREPAAAFVAALCNMEVEVIAPRRASVVLAGELPVSVPRSGRRERLARVPMDGYTAGSLGHDEDAAAPHLITLLAPDGSTGSRPLKAVPAGSRSLWERAAGADSRLYVAGGRFKSMLGWQVTGFFGAAEYERILGPYERELQKHLRQGP
ncbi:MAG: hypothetical protein ABIL09_17975, partial [Gemmatimonadota bacterium]